MGKDTRSHTASDKKLNGVWERDWSHKSQGYIQSCKTIVRGNCTRVVSLEVTIQGWYRTRVSHEAIIWGYRTRVSHEAIVRGYRTRLLYEDIAWGYCMRISYEAIVRGYCTRISYEDIVRGYRTRVSYEAIVWGYCTRLLYEDIVWGYFTRLLYEDIVRGYCTRLKCQQMSTHSFGCCLDMNKSRWVNWRLCTHVQISTVCTQGEWFTLRNSNWFTKLFYFSSERVRYGRIIRTHMMTTNRVTWPSYTGCTYTKLTTAGTWGPWNLESGFFLETSDTNQEAA